MKKEPKKVIAEIAEHTGYMLSEKELDAVEEYTRFSVYLSKEESVFLWMDNYFSWISVAKQVWQFEEDVRNEQAKSDLSREPGRLPSKRKGWQSVSFVLNIRDVCGRENFPAGKG